MAACFGGLLCLTGQAAAQAPATPAAPDPRVRHVRVAFHFVLDAKGAGSFDERGDNQPGNGTTPVPDTLGGPPQYYPTAPHLSGYEVAEAIVDTANSRQPINPVQFYHGPKGYKQLDEVARLPKPWAFVLTGVYFHRTANDSLRLFTATNRFTSALNDSFGVGGDSVVNFYLLVHRNPAYLMSSGNSGGFGFSHGRGWIKVVGQWPNWGTQKWWTPAMLLHLGGNLLCHEFGHLGGLSHPFDGFNRCRDVPPPLPGWDKSDNLMDYNWNQRAASPCQIETVLRTLDTAPGRAYVAARGAQPVQVFGTLPARVQAGDSVVLDARACYAETAYTLRVATAGRRGAAVRTLYRGTFQGPAGRLRLDKLWRPQPGTYRVTLTVENAAGHAATSWPLRVVARSAAPTRKRR